MNKIREQGCHDDDGAYYGQHDHYDRPALSVVCHEWIPPHFGEGPTRLGSSGKELKATTPARRTTDATTATTHRSPRRSDHRGLTIGGSGSRAGTGTEVITDHRRAFYQPLAIARAGQRGEHPNAPGGASRDSQAAYSLGRGRQRRRREARARVSNPMPNSTIAMDSVIALVQSEQRTRQPGHGGYVSVATERGASGFVAEKIGQSIRCFTLRVRLRAFVADQEFGDRARHVVHPTNLERGDREALRWSDASTRDENSHAGVKSKAQANAGTSICRQCPLRPTAIQTTRRLGQRDRAAGSTFREREV